MGKSKGASRSAPTSVQLIKRIKTLQRALDMDDATYRDTLAQYGATSCTQLGNRAAAELSVKLQQMAVDLGVWQDRQAPGKLKYSEYDGRPEPMASGKQMRMIDAMWKGVSYIKDERAREVALNKFVKRITGKDALIWIEHNDVRKLIAAIKSMKSQQTKGDKNVISQESGNTQAEQPGN